MCTFFIEHQLRDSFLVQTGMNCPILNAEIISMQMDWSFKWNGAWKHKHKPKPCTSCAPKQGNSLLRGKACKKTECIHMTNWKDQSFWEPSCSSRRQIPCNLWNRNFHYSIDRCPTFAPILKEIKSFHTLPYYLFKTYFNIILPSMSRTSKESLYFRFFHHSPTCISIEFYACHMLYPSQPPEFINLNNA